MRATALVLLAASVLPLSARAGETCPWRDPGHPPRTFLQDRVLFFRAHYMPNWAACVAKQDRKLEIQFLVGDEVVDKKAEQIYAGKGDDARQLEGRLFPSQVCEKKATTGKRAVQGRPGDEHVAQLVPVRARVVAQGALAPLAFTSPVIDFPCPACGSGSGSVYVRPEPNGNLVLEAAADRPWFDCARQEATLTLLGFAGESHKDVTNAVRPDFVLEGLEKAFTREGDKYVLRKPLPMERLCNKGRVWSFEVWGRGELLRMGGGGRAIYDLRCR